MNLFLANPFNVFSSAMSDVGNGICDLGRGVGYGAGKAKDGVSYAGGKIWGGVRFLSGKAWNAAKSTGSFVREHSPFYSIPSQGLVREELLNNQNILLHGTAKEAVVLTEDVAGIRELRSATQKVCMVALLGVAFTAFMIFLAVQQKSSMATTFAVIAGFATAGGTGYFLYQRHQHKKSLYGDKEIVGCLNANDTGEHLKIIYASIDINSLGDHAHARLLEIKKAFDKQYKKEIKDGVTSFVEAQAALKAKINACAPQGGN